jgi:putative hydrolase of the HAD superfamily
MTKVGAVLFDYGMVLSGPPDEAANARLRELLGANKEAFDAAYWAHRDAYDRGALSGEAYWLAVAGDLGQNVTAAKLANLIDADTALWTQPNHAMIAWAAELQRCGIKTGILSNLGDAMEDGILAKFSWMGGFDHHTFSHRLGIAKPDAAIYEHAAHGLQVPAREILFVDDRVENIEAARAAEMIAIRYSDHAAFIAELERLKLGWLLSPCAKT